MNQILSTVKGAPHFFLLKRRNLKSVAHRQPQTTTRVDTEAYQDRVLVCRLCGNIITYESLGTTIAGAQCHTFANPYGHIYQIGCFRNAPGVLVDLTESTDFTWFQGFAWSIAICNWCGTHLGWRFSAESSVFYGLILVKLATGHHPTLQ